MSENEQNKTAAIQDFAAFPCHRDINPCGPSGGMSMRDYFAAKIMAAEAGHWLLAFFPVNKADAESYYKQADAMLAARSAKERT